MVKKYPNDSLTCIKRFPREFNETIIVNADGYPIYRKKRKKKKKLFPSQLIRLIAKLRRINPELAKLEKVDFS